MEREIGVEKVDRSTCDESTRTKMEKSIRDSRARESCPRVHSEGLVLVRLAREIHCFWIDYGHWVRILSRRRRLFREVGQDLTGRDPSFGLTVLLQLFELLLFRQKDFFCRLEQFVQLTNLIRRQLCNEARGGRERKRSLAKEQRSVLTASKIEGSRV